MTHPLIGFIGQGFVGKNMADDFEERGFEVVRYALSAKYAANKEKIPTCDIVFIAVPTPTTHLGFDDSAVRESVRLVGPDKVAVIKSTVLPGTTTAIQKDNPDKIVLFSPEFLSAATAAEDARHPFINIIGMTEDSTRHKDAATLVSLMLPTAPKQFCSSTEAELAKYGHNAAGFINVVFFNVLFELARELEADWSKVETALLADPYIAQRYAKPLENGRGAGGGCFIKDFSAFKDFYRRTLPDDPEGQEFLEAAERENIKLLVDTGKDLDILKTTYPGAEDMHNLELDKDRGEGVK